MSDATPAFTEFTGDPALANEVLYSRQGSRGKVYAFQDGTQIVGTRRARAKVNEMRKAAQVQCALSAFTEQFGDTFKAVSEGVASGMEQADPFRTEGRPGETRDQWKDRTFHDNYGSRPSS